MENQEPIGNNPSVTIEIPVMSRDHLDRMISRSEAIIAESLQEMSIVEPDLAEAKKRYEDLLKQYTDIENIKLEEEKVLETFVRYRQGYKSKQEINLIRTTSHTKKKPKVDEEGKKINISWSALATEILLEANRFMKAEDIFDTIVHRNESMRNWDQRTYGKYRWSFINVIIKVPCQKFKKKGKGTFVEYNNLIGLPDWVDSHQRPEPEFLAQFMMAQ